MCIRDRVLTDDNFATIREAVREGREIYANIKKTVIFLLSSNFGEIMTMFFSILFSFPAPLKASHILWINLITDALPALALGKMCIRDSRCIEQHNCCNDHRISSFSKKYRNSSCR